MNFQVCVSRELLNHVHNYQYFNKDPRQWR